MGGTLEDIFALVSPATSACVVDELAQFLNTV